MQGQIVSAMLKNFGTVEKSLNSMEHSAGSAMREMEVVSESLDFKLNALKETGVGIAQNVFNREDLGEVIDGFTQFLGLLDGATEKLGLFGTLGSAGGLALLVKNLGNIKKGFSMLAAGEAASTVMSKGFGKMAGAIGLSTTALGGFLAVAAGIGAVAAIVDALTVSYDELKDKATESRTAFEDTQSELQSLNTELDANKQKIDELKGKEKLSLTDEKELRSLERRNKFLEKQIEYEEKLADIQAQQAATDAGNVIDEAAPKYNNYKELVRRKEDERQGIIDRLNQYTPEDIQNNSRAYQQDLAALKETETELATLQSGLAELGADMTKNISSLYDSETGDIFEDKIQQATEYYEAMNYVGTAEEIAAQKHQELQSIMESDEFEKPIEGLQEFVEKSNDGLMPSLDQIKEKLGEDTFGELQQQLAESGISMEEFAFSLSDASKNMQEMSDTDLAANAKDAMEQLSKYDEYTKDIGTHTSDSRANAAKALSKGASTAVTDEDVRRAEELTNTIAKMQAIQQIPGIDVSDYEAAETVIAQCQSELDELGATDVSPQMDTSGLSKADQKVQSLITEFQQVSKQRDNRAKYNLDTSEADAKLESLRGKIENANVKAKVDVDTSSVDNLKKSISQKQTVNVSTNVDNKVKQLPPQQAKGTVTYENKTTKLPPQKASGTINWANNYSTPSNLSASGTIWWTNRERNSRPSGGSVPYNGTAHRYGTAHFYGTAYAGGDWGAKHGGRALVGELGPEVRVNSRTGKWELLGAMGAEFANINPNDIIFNHEQTASLLANGYVRGRGTAIARGTAFANGTIGGNAYKSGTEKKLEKFQKWFDKFFDWIEIRLDRHSKRIEQLTKKAELAEKRGKYKTAAKDYGKAMTQSEIQLGLENIAAGKYQSKANAVLKKARKQKLISKKQVKSIAEGVASGRLDISKYGKKTQEVIKSYKEFYDKAQEARDAVIELKEEIYDYIGSLKDLREAQREATISMSESFSKIGSSGLNSRSSFKGSQLASANAQIAIQQEAYAKGVTNLESDLSGRQAAAAKSAKSSLTSAAKNAGKIKVKKGKKKKKLSAKEKKTYTDAIKSAQSYINQGKKIPDSVLNKIKKYNTSTYNQLIAYNTEVDLAPDIQKAIEDARLEAAEFYAESSADLYQNKLDIGEAETDYINDQIDLLTKQADAAETLVKKNEKLASAAANYTDLAQKSRELASSLKKEKTDLSSQVSNTTGMTSLGANLTDKNNKYGNAVSEAKSCAVSGKAISAETLSVLAEGYSKGYVEYSFYQSCIDYNNALNAAVEAEYQAQIDEATAKLERASIGSDIFSNTKNEFENKQRTIESASSLAKAKQDVRETKGFKLNAGDYTELIRYNTQMISSYRSEVEDLNKVIQSNLKNGYWDEMSQEYLDAVNEVAELEEKIVDCENSQEEYNNAIAKLPYDTLDEALDRLDAIEKYYKSILDLNEQLGVDSTAEDYAAQIAYMNSQLEKTREQANQAEADMEKARTNGGVFGGKTTEEWETEYYKYLADINELEESIDKLQDEMRDDVMWRAFEKAHEAAERLRDTLDGISDLIDDDMLFDAENNFTEYGITKVGLLAKQFENSRQEVQNFADDIRNLTKLYDDGLYTEDEYNEKLAELRKNMLDSAGDMKSYIMEVRDMYKDIEESELDSLKKLIDARSKAIQKKKDYYDLDKRIRDKTKDIQELSSEIAALEQINTAEARSKMAKLQEELAEATEDLADERREHLFDISSDALDDMQDILEDEFDEKWDNLTLSLDDMKQLLEDANELYSKNTGQIASSLNKLLAFYGVSGVDTHFASGTRRVSQNLVGLSQDSGSEILVTQNGLISHFKPGDGVVPSTLTKRLYAMANGQLPVVGGGSGLGITEVNQHYDSLINIEGSADAATVEDLKQLGQQLLEKSYDYTTRRIKQDYVRTGGLRKS